MTLIRIVLILALHLRFYRAICQYSYPYYYVLPRVQNPVSVTRAGHQLCWYGEWISCRVTPSKMFESYRSETNYIRENTETQLYHRTQNNPIKLFGITGPTVPKYSGLQINNLHRTHHFHKLKVPTNQLQQDFNENWSQSTSLGHMEISGSIPSRRNTTYNDYNTNNILINGKIENVKIMAKTVPPKFGHATKPHEPQNTETVNKVTATAAIEDKRHNNETLYVKFLQSLDQFDRKFFKATFEKLSAMSAPERRENGISFVQSGLLLHLVLTTIAMQVDKETRNEIDNCLDFPVPDNDKIIIMEQIVSSLPASSADLKLRWSSRLMLSINVSRNFKDDGAKVSSLHIDRFNGTLTPSEMTKTLNRMVEVDSGSSMHSTFEEDELSDGVRAVLMSVAYVRPRWRAAPTLLNGTRPFYDAGDAPQRRTRMLRINDIMRYADLTDWEAEALEISYATPGLRLLLLLPRGHSLRALSQRLAQTTLKTVTDRMQTMRVAASLPLYTLRMTLLLPSKLQAMGVSRLVDTNSTTTEELRLSHAVQRLMFWAEAGRNAFKDDGIEWDESPKLHIVVDRPYVFYIRWHNLTLVNGNFVL